MNKEEAAKKIAALTEQAEQLVREAQAVANEHTLDFYFSIAYGMGGYYTGHGSDWEPSEHEYGLDEDGWAASSNSC